MSVDAQAWRIWCDTEECWHEWILRLDAPEPTTCPVNSAHVIDDDKTYVTSKPFALVKVDDEGNQKVVREPTPGTEKNFYAPNMTDQTTWYPSAAQATEQALTHVSDYKTYSSSDVCWIDVTHGKLFKESDALATELAGCIPTIEVQVEGAGDWVEQTENSWGKTDHDFTVDYKAGTLTFNDALGATDLVRATYKRADGYHFYVEPGEGKELKIVYAEVQYTQDIDFDTTVKFDFEYNHPSYGWVKVGGINFKRMQDYYQESTGPFPVIPAHGGPVEIVEVTGIASIQGKLDAGYVVKGAWHDGTDPVALMEGIEDGHPRAIHKPIVTVPFNYNAFTKLSTTNRLRIHIRLEEDIPFGGEFANITFYCFTSDE